LLRRKSPNRVAVGNSDRLVFCGLYRLSLKVLDALKIFQPETVIRWHRAGFRGRGAGNRDRAAAGPRRRRTFASSFSSERCQPVVGSSPRFHFGYYMRLWSCGILGESLFVIATAPMAMFSFGAFERGAFGIDRC
jgi:hypothetical protein